MWKIGLLGKNLSHTYSPEYFRNKFLELGLKDLSYEIFDFDDLKSFIDFLNCDKIIIGFNVTIPYKEEILNYVDFQSEEVAKIGAANVIGVRRQNKKFFLEAHNTDVFGFEASLKNFLDKSVKNALIIGWGGAAKAVAFVLDKIGINYKVVNRTLKEGVDFVFDTLKNEAIINTELIVNTTPLGQKNYEQFCPPINYSLINEKHYCFDLVYNPPLTLFLKKCFKQGAKIKNGLEMLYLQADRSLEIFLRYKPL